MRNRIRELRDAKGLSQTQLGELVDAHWQTIQRLETGATLLNTEWMERLAGPLGVSSPLELLEERNVRMIDVRGFVQAGYWAEAFELHEDERRSVPIPDDPGLARMRLVGLEVRGPSMNRVYPEGTVVVATDQIEVGDDLIAGKRYVVQRERADGLYEATVKRFWRDNEGNPWMVPESDDPRFQEPIPLFGDGPDGDTLRILGRVVFSVTRE